MTSVETLEERVAAMTKQHETEMKAITEQHSQTRTRLRELEARERNYLFKGLMVLGAMVAGSGLIGYGASKL